MSRTYSPWRIPLLLLVLVILVLLFLFRSNCCRLLCTKTYPTDDTTKYVQKISWNILFKDNVSITQKENTIEDIKDSIRKFYDDHNRDFGTNFIPQFEPTAWCPCDSALYNLNFKCIDGSGSSVGTLPPGKKIGGKGNLIDVVAISDNIDIVESVRPNTRDTPIVIPYEQKGYYLNRQPRGVKRTSLVRGIAIQPDKILAILDSGIDSTLFTPSIQDFVWHDPSGAPTLYNFLPYQPVSDLFDSGGAKHGSAVTSLMINAIGTPVAYPRIMVLKALDKKERGSIFSVSCAMSYAIKHNATMINASLGYKGDEDSILKHYVALCASHTPNPIELFVAAGNVAGSHEDSLLCSKDFNNNLLTPDSLFYPAAFSKQFENVTSVTQIHDQSSSCYYQYFSKDYITLGILDDSSCCYFRVDFRGAANYYEGSSFATPIASGLKMAIIMLTNNDRNKTDALWNALFQTAPPPFLTKNGKYLLYNK